MSIVPAFKELARYNQFILWRIIGADKIPMSPAGHKIDPHTPTNWMTYERAEVLAVNGLEIGFVFTSGDPFFFVDLDKCREGDHWSKNALAMLGHFPGAAVEVSCSGNGLHIIGQYSGAEPVHKCKNKALKMELYTSKRFVALTQERSAGDCARVCDTGLAAIIPTCFPVDVVTGNGVEWRDEPVDSWNGVTDDAELIEKACNSSSGASAFGGGCSFRDLWENNEDALAAAYPDSSGLRAYDASSADGALAQRLAFWTGNNHERIQRLMMQSALTRDKWDREDYLPRTISGAVSRQSTVYGERAVVVEGLPGLACTSDSQRLFAEQVRAGQLAKCATEAQRLELSEDRAPLNTATFWLDNQGSTPEELRSKSEPIATAGPLQVLTAERVNGIQYLNADMQIEHFQGCVYIQNLHSILTPAGALLESGRFNAAYGGYSFQMDDTGAKTTRKAWDVFTESQCVRFPKVETTAFKPGRPSGEITVADGLSAVNTYVELDIERIDGDLTPFLTQLKKILPVEHDREIFLAYMAACVQHKGVKFQWAPLLQGVEGNGKTFFTYCVAAAVGRRYTHYPKAMDIDNKFNGWLMNKLFIGIEDVYTGHRTEIIETLKPMITSSEGLEIQKKGFDQITFDVCANFMLNSNHMDAIKKTGNDRRFAFFYSPQQCAADLDKSGMGGDYFPKLWAWLKKDGYAIVSKFLHEYDIPDALNPAKLCHRAPETSSTKEAVQYSLGNVDQLIMEAIGEDRVGFCGGWISSMAVDRILLENRIKLSHNKRKEMIISLGYGWHPGLDKGRANNRIEIDAGKPRLFIKEGHLARELTNASEISKSYEAAQTKISTNVLSASAL